MTKKGGKQQRPSMSSVEPSKRKKMRVNSPLFVEDINTLLLAWDQSDSEGGFEEYIISESELLKYPGGDQDEDSEDSPITPVGYYISRNKDNVPLTELRPSNFYNGKNRFKLAKTPPNARVLA